ncbi:MAG TPA: extracellular solute-binding protein [bacterium]|nr:extracellular solute-binding protein [bacterium]
MDAFISADSDGPSIGTPRSRRDFLALAGKGATVLASSGGLASLLEAVSAQSANAGPAAGKGPVEGEISFTWWGTGERSQKTQAVMALFEQKYPKAKIQGQPVGDFNTYWQKLTVEAAARNLPDVPQMQVRYLAVYATRNVLRPLDDLVQSGAIDVSGMPKVLVDSGRGRDGKLYMVPTGSATNNWIYNASIAEKAGLAPLPPDMTWEQLQKWLLDAKDKMPAGVYAGDLRGGGDAEWWAWVSSHGQPVFSKSGKLGFSKELMVQYWNWWETLRKAGATVPAAMMQEEPTDNQQGYITLGKVMFDQRPANQLPAIQAPLTASGKGTLRLAAFPRRPSGNGQVLVNNGLSIAANCTNIPAAAAWINFFTNDPDGAKAYASSNGAVTVTKLLDAQIAETGAGSPATKEYLQFIKGVIAGRPTIVDFPPNYTAVVQAIANNYSNVAFGKATVESAVDAFFSQANAATS